MLESTRLEIEAGKAALAKRMLELGTTTSAPAPTLAPVEEVTLVAPVALAPEPAPEDFSHVTIEALHAMTFAELRALGTKVGTKGRGKAELISEIGAILGLMEPIAAELDPAPTVEEAELPVDADDQLDIDDLLGDA